MAVMLAAAGLRAAPAPEFETAQGGPHGVDMPMDLDPTILAMKHNKVYDPRLKDLWEKALNHGEANLKLHACESFARAQAGGMPGLGNLVPKFVALVQDDKQTPEVRAAAAEALSVFDARDHANVLLEWSRSGRVDRVLVADPALARWKTPAAIELWMQRLQDQSTPDQVLRSAIRSLGDAAIAEAAKPLQAIVKAPGRDPSTRLTAANALSKLAPEAVKPVIADLAKASTADERMLAAAMAPIGKDPQVAAVLVALCNDPEPAVVAVAAEKLMKGSPESLQAQASRLAGNDDVEVRRIAVDALRFHASPENVAVLGRLLGDEAPPVRVAAREMLIEIDALPNLREPVRAQAMKVLEGKLTAGNKDYGIEQAAYILAALKHLEARDRLVELLNAPDRRVRLATTVALRRLAIENTLQPQFDRAKEIVRLVKTPAKNAAAPAGSDVELAQLMQNFGIARFKPADHFMRQFIPKDSVFGVRSRTAAIWALGYLYEGTGEPNLAASFESGLMDTNPITPEAIPIRYISAVSLGHMKARKMLGSLETVKRTDGGQQLGEAAIWAIAQIENKPFVPTPPSDEYVSNWFLEPITNP